MDPTLVKVALAVFSLLLAGNLYWLKQHIDRVDQLVKTVGEQERRFQKLLEDKTAELKTMVDGAEEDMLRWRDEVTRDIADHRSRLDDTYVRHREMDQVRQTLAEMGKKIDDLPERLVKMLK